MKNQAVITKGVLVKKKQSSGLAEGQPLGTVTPVDIKLRSDYVMESDVANIQLNEKSFSRDNN